MPRSSLPLPTSHHYHAKSQENIENKKTAKELPGPRRARFGSTLTARDPNTRGSKSSVSSVEETFHTALKEQDVKKSTKYNRSKVFRNSTYSNREKENVPKVEFHDADEDGGDASPRLKDHREEPTKSPRIVDLESELESELSKANLLPEGVVNICIDEGLYEYSREVFVYLRDVEKALPTDYLGSGSISSSMRMILVDWLTQVQHHLKLTQESLYLCVNILDAVLLERDVDPDKLQLVGVTSLLMATKLEEYYPAEVGKLLHLTENSYSRKDVLMMERVVLQVLKFQCYIPTAQVFLLRYTRAALRSNDEQFYETCCFIIDSQLVLPTHPCFRASETAAAATLLSLLLYHLAFNGGQEVPEAQLIWTKSLEHFSGFKIGEILEPATIMVDQMIAACNEDYKYRGAVKKYQSQSQHKKLAYQDHVQEENLRKAKSVLKTWLK